METHHSMPPAMGIKLIKIAVAYLLLGLLLGIAMAASHQFQLRPVHTHINLLGWVTLALTGLLYCQFPQLASGRLAAWHYRLHNLGLPIMMAGLAAYSLGQTQFEPLIAAGSLLVTAGLALFGLGIFRRLAPHNTAAAVIAQKRGTAESQA